ncbi:MAG: alpha-amylase [Hyphomonadaceae bacterium]|nr:alpha-amylase [Hyphomonadaceae bacterium]
MWRMALAAASALALLADDAAAQESQRRLGMDRLPQDEVVYFVLPDRFENGNPRNDRGGLRGGRLRTGFDPAHKGFYHGGDLAGLTRRLDYVQGLGATAIWLAPVYENKPVQGAPGDESAGYHGYWITDFTNIDPHFGTRAEFRAFVDAAHARGMRVYMDIITNHTADVIQYQDCPIQACAFRSRADYPYARRGGVDGPIINEGFNGDSAGYQTAENFARLTNPNFAYETYIPRGERNVKTPAWLNDPIYYHNRGNTTFRGESSQLGDFVGLDDLFTEHPRVVAGMIEIYGAWIDEFGVDGFRIDTARHVNPQFWQAFVPAMLARARARGIENFYIFGEVFDPDPGRLARFTRVDGFPAVLDFAFQSAAYDAIVRGTGTDRLNTLYESDVVYQQGPDTAIQLPIFLGNHDMGRFGHFLIRENPGISDDELLRRSILGHALMMFSRGAPVIYYGDEQGFTGDGNDQDAREDMFPSQVASYNDNRLVGTNATTAESNFDPNHPLYRAIAEMAGVRAAQPSLRRGRQVVRNYVETPGLFAFSRIHEGVEILVVLNTGREPLRANVEVEPTSLNWRALHGRCSPRAGAPGSVAVELAGLDYLVCIAEPAP